MNEKKKLKFSVVVADSPSQHILGALTEILQYSVRLSVMLPSRFDQNFSTQDDLR